MLGRVGKVGRLGSIGGLEGIPAPDLQLNFDQASIGANAAPDDAIDFSRASQATFTDSDGLVKYAPHNLILQSEDFSTTWSTTNASVTTNNTTAPDGTTTADKITDNTASGIHRVSQTVFSLTQDINYTASIYLKKDTARYVKFFLFHGSSDEHFINVDLEDGSLDQNNSFDNASVDDVGNGWYRLVCSMQNSSDTNTTITVDISNSSSYVTNYTGSSSSPLSIYAWGAQLSQHKFVPIGNPYIKTTTAAVYGARLDHEAGYFLSSNQAQNLILDSETIANASSGWLTTAATANSTDVPSGIGADNSTQITYSANAQVYNFVNNIVAGETYTFSYYVKLGTKSNNKYAVYDDTANAFIVAIAVNTSASASEWTRFSLTVTAPANCDQLRFYVDRADNSGEYGTTFITGVQVEVGSTATTYNQTNGLEYYGGGATQNGLLIEEQRVNQLVRSEELATTWFPIGVAVTSNNALSPDGTQNSEKLTEDSSNGGHRILQTGLSVTSGKSYTLSVFAKTLEGRTVDLRFTTFNSGFAFSRGTFNLTTGVATNNTGFPLDSLSIKDYGNGWFRCMATKACTGTTTNAKIEIGLNDDLAGNYAGDGSSSIFLWGAQFEEGAFATSYIPTTSATVTRSADLATMGPVTGTNLILQSEDLSTTWSTFDTSIITDDITAPDGLSTADKLVESATTAQHLLVQNVTYPSDKIFVFSVYAKADERNIIQLQAKNNASNFPFARFNLSTGSVNGIGGSAIDAQMQNAGDGWYKCNIVFDTESGSTTTNVTVLPFNGGQSYTGDGSSGLHVWGAQLEQAPTLITDAEDFSAWASPNSGVTTNVIAAPDGNTTADKITEDAVSSSHYIYKNLSLTGNTRITCSVFAKAAEREELNIAMSSTFFVTSSANANFHLGNETVTPAGVGNPTGSITNVGNGWYRCVFSVTISKSGTGQAMQTIIRKDGQTTYLGDGSSGLYLWGAQVEEGASATPYPPEPTKYLPTYASTNLPFVGYNLNEGTVEADFEVFDTDATGHIYYINDGGATFKGFGMRFGSNETLDVMTRDASAFNNGGNSAAKSTNTLIKTSATYDGVGHIFMAVDGVTTTTTGQSTVNITNNDEVDFFGSSNIGVGGSNYKSNGILKRFAYYASRLKDDFVKRLS